MSGTILIVDDVATNRIVLKVKLSVACYETLQACDGESALRVARSARPDLVLLDLVLPDISGIEVCRQLKADPATSEIPVIIISAQRDPADRRAALRAGARDYLTKPVDETLMMARIRSLMRAREAEAELQPRDGSDRALGFAEAQQAFEAPGTIALIAADRERAVAWRRALSPLLHHRLVVMPHETALADGGPAPDVYMIAADLARPGEGLRLMSELRSRTPTRHAAVCIVLPEGDAADGAMALDLGASELIHDASDAEETALRLAAQLRRKRRSDRLRDSVRAGLELAMTDALTGLHNRRYALPQLSRIAEQAAATGRRYAVLLMDIDRFKAVNDTFGHAAGDAVLVEVAQRMRDSLRSVDLLARIGGEEFLAVMPDVTLSAAEGAAERLREVIEAVPVRLPGDAGLVSVTLSIGLALGGPDAGAPEEAPRHPRADAVLALADSALLAAKAEGRNKVTVGRQTAA